MELELPPKRQALQLQPLEFGLKVDLDTSPKNWMELPTLSSVFFLKDLKTVPKNSLKRMSMDLVLH